MPPVTSVPATRDRARAYLRRSLSSPDADFRPGQWEAIDALVNDRRKLLVVERTGWGKSTVYFIVTRLLRERGAGPTLIISPLLALMHNQIEAATRLGVQAISIDSTNQEDWENLMEQAVRGEADVLLVSPERLANDVFVRRVLTPISQRLGLLVVDEAHCISDWGHDFRPDYRRIIHVLRQMPPGMPVLGTTATANNRVLEDVRSQLGNITIQRGSLMRESLVLQNLHFADQAERLAWMGTYVPRIPGTGIIYTLTTRDADQVATWLQENGIDAHAYFSGIEREEFESTHAYRAHLEEQLKHNQIKALVATTALGMGYDKPDLGFVIHYQMPGSVIAYYQQVGRAGRAIPRAFGILMSGPEDDEIHAYFRRTAFPEEHHVRLILRALERSDGLSIVELDQVINLRRSQIEQALKYMASENPSPVFKDGSKWKRTPVVWQMDHEQVARLTRQREVEWAEMQAYIKTETCLMQFLARALDDASTGACGKCPSCRGKNVIPTKIPHEMITRALRFIRQSEHPLSCRTLIPRGALPVSGLEGNLKKRNLSAEVGRILSRYNDPGWGWMVAQDKEHHHFRDELVEAVREMIVERWKPDPAPEWVTCIPSRNHPQLVPGFAKRLALRLGLPFVNAIEKVRANDPQKHQENSYHQARNLDGVFRVAGVRQGEPVLLVDDMVDSGWTLTVAAALLRQAGSGPVYPLALADTSVNE